MTVIRICPECRASYEKRRVDQVFCSVRCNGQAEARGLRRARTIYRALYWWRFDRKHCASYIVFMCREIASWIDEDRKSQRKPPPKPNFSKELGSEGRYVREHEAKIRRAA